uniref:Uncharacterized protein n=1 Tax=Anguilla anguilla TaxID=7936 RepID=A0A0E9RX03_ANGAN
MKASGRVVG